MPTEHNQGIHRSIDNAQEWLIGQYNARRPFDANLALDYCGTALTLMEQDDDLQRFQYDKCKNEEILAHWETVRAMRECFQAKMQRTQENNGGVVPGSDFVLDQNNFKP